MTITTSLDRDALAAWYRRNRERSRVLFDLLADEAYYEQPIALRHPIVFYDGHLPAFSFNTLVKKGLGRPAIDLRLETLFARGIDPHEQTVRGAGATGEVRGRSSEVRGRGSEVRGAGWPSRDDVRGFAAEADRLVLDAILNGDIEQPGHPLLDNAEAVFAILEHEAMHQETLLYMWHRLPVAMKRRPGDYLPIVGGAVPPAEWIDVPAGRATLGVARGSIPFGWDNEFGPYAVDVPPFAIERHDVTNARYMEFVDAGGYQDPRWWAPDDWAWVAGEGIAHPLFWERSGSQWLWRGMFDLIPLPPAWPVYVSHAEATAYARWRGARLPSEAEYQRAVLGSPVCNGVGSSFPDELTPETAPDPVTNRSRPPGVFDFSSWDPQPAGSHPKGASEWGVEDLIGNGWEWTSTTFAPFPGFTPMASYPEYSADFFDGEHFVMKGASPATARELVRPTFRNWFRGRYPYVYATFRCVKDA